MAGEESVDVTTSLKALGKLEGDQAEKYVSGATRVPYMY